METRVIIAITLIVGLILFLFCHKFFGKFQWFKRFSCKVGWHSYPDYEIVNHDGASFHAKCKWCGYKGMIDSQGNLF